MAKFISGFKGLRFNLSKIDLSKSIAPPYDVFNYGDETDKALRVNKNNIVHIQKPAGDGDIKYKKAKDILSQYLRDNILIQDDKNGIYILKQTWGNKQRIGAIAAVRLDESYQKIKRHEKTKEGPKIDRLKLIRATGLNIGAIFLFFKDDNNIFANDLVNLTNTLDLTADFEFPKGINNKIYISYDYDINGAIGTKTFYIADGHHRYQTMIDYRDILKKDAPLSSEGSSDYVMSYIAPHSELTILPYYRLLRNIPQDLLDTLMNKINNDFNIADGTDSVSTPATGQIGIFIGDKYYIVSPKKATDIIDIELLHTHILEPYLGLEYATIKKSDDLHYFSGDTDLKEISKLIMQNEYQAAFIINAPSYEQIMAVSDKNGSMPPKSTFFFPKIPSGIVLYQAKNVFNESA